MDFKRGQAVLYENTVVEVEERNDNGTYAIINPQWDWDMEWECIDLGIDYDVDYWLTVEGEELKEVK